MRYSPLFHPTALGKRQLRVESLESRRLLATDTLATDLPFDDRPADWVVPTESDTIVLFDEVFPGWTIMREVRPAHPLRPAATSTAGDAALSTTPMAASAANGTSPIITLKKGPALLANPAASAAFDEAAAILASLFTDPIEIVIDANLAELAPNILGSTGSEEFFDEFDLIRDLLVADADPITEAIVADLPTGASIDVALPGGNPKFKFSGDMTATRASLLALGVTPDEFIGGADSDFDPGVPRDMDITFSSTFPFDFDRSDGISAGKFDFVGVALHEMVHGFGFVSNVDQIDFLLDHRGISRSVEPSLLDLFRLAPGDGAADFTGATRILDPNVADQVFYDGGIHDFTATGFAGITVGDVPLSTGVSDGDGRQASHWKDNTLISGVNIGIMDPTVRGKGVLINIESTDIRALGLIGWDIAVTDTPPPQVIDFVRNDGNERFDRLTSLAFSFDEDVSASVDKLDLSLLNTSTGVPVDLALASVAFDGATNTATWDLSGVTIDVGFHTVTLGSVGINDEAGNPLDGDANGAGGDDFQTTLLVAIAGDADLDGEIDGDDIQLLLAANKFGQGMVGATWSEGDFDDDGDVDAVDIQRILATNKFADGPYAATTGSGSDATFAASTSPTTLTASAPGRSVPIRSASAREAADGASTGAGTPGQQHRPQPERSSAERWSAGPRAVGWFGGRLPRDMRRSDRVERTPAIDVIVAPTTSADERADQHGETALAARLDGRLVEAAWDEALLTLVDQERRDH